MPGKLSHTITSEGGPIDHRTEPFTSNQTLMAVRIFSIIPSTTENIRLTVSLHDPHLPAHDLKIIDIDMITITDYVETDMNLQVGEGEHLHVAYANPDANTIGIKLVLQ